MQELIIAISLIYGSLFVFSMISSMFDFDISKSMYPEYWNKINEKERLNNPVERLL